MEYISKIIWTKLSQHIGIEEQIFVLRRVFYLLEQTSNRDSHDSVNGEIMSISSGSRAEGLSFSDSDLDIMYILFKISVSDNLDTLYGDMYMDTTNIKPGFVRLKCLNGMRKYVGITESMTQINDGIFLSSLLFRDFNVEVIRQHFPNAFAHGPCSTFVDEFKLETDNLLCFTSKQWPQLASEWQERERSNNWPSHDLISDIVQDGCLLVPIGNPNSQESYMQWRISFSLAEKKLVHSFNHTQMLCYGLLKLYLKHVINSNLEVKGLLCSYFLKTSLFYCIEEENITWNKENLLNCFWTCYRRLLKCVRDEYCPNYFIKQNNMFEGKICGRNRQILLSHLFELYNDGVNSMRFIPCLSDLHIFDRNRTVSNTADSEILISEKECLCDRLILYCSFCDVDGYSLDEVTSLHIKIGHMIQQSPTITDRTILTLMYYNTICNTIPSLYRTILSSTTNKKRYKQMKGLKQLIIQNCMVGDVCTGRLMLATLCYLNMEYKEVVTIIQKVLKKFKPFTLYRGQSAKVEYSQAYANQVCGKSLTMNQKLSHGIVARPFICHIDYKFYALEIEPELVQSSNRDRKTYIPPMVYCNVLLFLSYHHMGCRVKMCNILNELYKAIKDDRFIEELEQPLAKSLLQRCLHICETA